MTYHQDSFLLRITRAFCKERGAQARMYQCFNGTFLRRETLNRRGKVSIRTKKGELSLSLLVRITGLEHQNTEKSRVVATLFWRRCPFQVACYKYSVVKIMRRRCDRILRS